MSGDNGLPAPPAGLADAGRELWAAIFRQLPPVPDGEEPWELSEREEAMLMLACRQADDLALLEAAIERDGAMTVGSKLQPVVNPAIAEARQARIAISRLLGSLQLFEGGTKPQTTASQRGQHAARARWGTGIEA